MIPHLRSLAAPSLVFGRLATRPSAVKSPLAIYCVQLENAAPLSTAPPKSKKKAGGIVAKYEAFLERKYPRVYKVHRMVTDGCKWCVSDMKTYYRIRRDLSQGRRTLTDLTTDELESYVQTSEEFAKLSGIVCLAVLPMTVYVIGFAILFFPRIILTRHFWSNEQRKEFWAHSLKVSAARHYQPILENLKVSNKDITIPTEFVNLKDVKIAPLIEFPYSHIVRLCMIHRCFPVPSVKRLAHRAEVLRELDSRQLNDLHLVDEMDDQQLYMHLFIRRLQYEGKTVPEMRELLKTWLIASKAISSDTSLMIHAPILCQTDGFKKTS